MKRLTDLFPLPTTFRCCQLCGHTSKDICEFEMLQECDDSDRPEEGNFLIRCKRPECIKMVEDHERLYYTVPWSTGGAGRFMLLCGDCEFRDGFNCTHKNLTKNGGNGLEVQFSSLPIFHIRVCFTDGTSYSRPPPAVKCMGKVSKRSLPVIK